MRLGVAGSSKSIRRGLPVTALPSLSWVVRVICKCSAFPRFNCHKLNGIR